MNTTLPVLYARWIHDLLDQTVEPEPHATCSTCAMCDLGQPRTRPLGRQAFLPEVKCCTYRPTLANFLVGALLSDASPEGEVGRRTVLARLAQGGHEVNPLGLGQNTSWQDPGERMGDPAYACPHLHEGRCGIWKYRDAVCATWWCKHDRGAIGHGSWLAMRALLFGVQSTLALYCAEQDDFPDACMYRLVALSRTVPGVVLSADVGPKDLWGPLFGQEQDYYLRCHERVKDLTWAQVLEIGGAALAGLARNARLRHAALDQPVPTRLLTGVHAITGVSADAVMVETYSSYDPIGLPAALPPHLFRFDGRPVDQVLAELETLGLVFDPTTLRLLVDMGLLVDADTPAGPGSPTPYPGTSDVGSR